MCKTRGGLRRHVATKHQERAAEEKKKKEDKELQETANKLHPLNIKVYVTEACKKIESDLNYSECVREKFKGIIISSNEALQIFNTYKELIRKFKNDPEWFFPEFCNVSRAAANPLTERFDAISYNLLILELSALFLKHLMGKNVAIENESTLTDNEVAALQYLAGHVVHKIYLKLRKSKNWRTTEFQHCIELLKAIKIDPNETHKLIKVKDRGGLWYICKEAEHIFLCAEMLFRQKTKSFITFVNYTEIVQLLRKDRVVKMNFSTIIDRSGVKINPDITKDLLEKLLGFYVRIRCHSYAKDVKDKHKIALKTAGKKRALRTELKKITTGEGDF